MPGCCGSTWARTWRGIWRKPGKVGADLQGLPGWSIEVKRANRPRLAEWWLQTCTQAEATGQRPALCYRLDRQTWRVVVALRHVATGFDHAPLGLRMETDLEVFAALVRESLQ